MLNFSTISSQAITKAQGYPAIPFLCQGCLQCLFTSPFLMVRKTFLIAGPAKITAFLLEGLEINSSLLFPYLINFSLGWWEMLNFRFLPKEHIKGNKVGDNRKAIESCCEYTLVAGAFWHLITQTWSGTHKNCQVKLWLYVQFTRIRTCPFVGSRPNALGAIQLSPT